MRILGSGPASWQVPQTQHSNATHLRGSRRVQFSSAHSDGLDDLLEHPGYFSARSHLEFRVLFSTRQHAGHQITLENGEVEWGTLFAKFPKAPREQIDHCGQRDGQAIPDQTGVIRGEIELGGAQHRQQQSDEKRTRAGPGMVVGKLHHRSFEDAGNASSPNVVARQ